MPSKLEQLDKIVARAFERAESKEEIKEATELKTTYEEAKKEIAEEQQELLNKHAELLKEYKDLVKHTSFSDKPTNDDTTPLSLEESLNAFISNHKE